MRQVEGGFEARVYLGTLRKMERCLAGLTGVGAAPRPGSSARIDLDNL